MSQYNKIFPFIYESKIIELAEGKKIQIQRTKQEPLFESFKDYEGLGQKLIREISENAILRQFVFLDSSTSYSPESPTGVFITYPICLDPNFDFVSRMEREDYKNQDAKIEAELDRANKILGEIYESYFTDTINTLIDNPEILKGRGREKTFSELVKNIGEALKKDPKIMQSFTERSYTYMSSAYQAQALLKIKDFAELAEKANKNALALSLSITLPDKYQQVHDAFSKLAKYAFLRTESLCLDCFYTHNDMPFSSVVSAGKSIDLVRQCAQCKDSGIIHKICIGYHSGASKLLMPNSKWMYELIIGYSLASLNFIKEVYIHKKLHGIVEGKVQKGVESDITVLTNDNKLILVEVTTQSDTDNIMNTIASKVQNLNESRIPYDKIMYFTSASKLPTYITMDAFKTRVFGMRHLYDIEYFVKEWLYPEQKAAQTQLDHSKV